MTLVRSLGALTHLSAEYPVSLDHLAADVPAAIKAVAVHRAEDWPNGPLCHNCHATHPCRLRRWGEQVLYAAGWSGPAIADVPRRVTAGERPWA